VSSATTHVVVSLGSNPSADSLRGVTAGDAVAGVATFAGLRLHLRGRGITLVASASGLTPAVSATFAVVSPLGLSSIVMGDEHGCGLDAGGHVYCWGQDSSGELGDGAQQPRLLPDSDSGVLLATVTAGAHHACGVDETGVAYCWGSNAVGQIGDSGNGSVVLVPTQVHLAQPFGFLSAGGDHTCGIISGTGVLYCWGANASGQLGDSSQVNRSVPVLVAGGHSFANFSAGRTHTCGILMTGGAYCWGSNANGELGDSTTVARSVPVAVAQGSSFQWVSAGDGHSCGLAPAGVGYCWGRNDYGQLGDRTTTPRLVPTPVAGGLHFSALLASASFTCAVTTGNQLYCWGRGTEGQLGNGSIQTQVTPQAVSVDTLTPSGITVGGQGACFITLNQLAYCWGANSLGQLGNGRTTPSSVPVQVVY
jgi:alpha-tubulin suppressor-like RCC1 family protein